MLWISPLVAVVAVLTGILSSYALDASSGGMIGVSLGVLFGIAYLAGPHGVITEAVRRRRRGRGRARAVAA
jgi:ABC-type Mn2+/Zn2+ transport system permease subunit